MANLRYSKGLLISDTYAPNLKWNERGKIYIGYGKDYFDVMRYFNDSEIEVKDTVLDLLPFPQVKEIDNLRDYQRDAVEKWYASKRGVVVLPTGAGKTLIGLKAIEKCRVASIVVVPTVDLLYQWAKSVEEKMGVKPGIVGNGENQVRGITVITYDSLYTKAEELGNKFGLMVFDEVHHLPSEGYSQAAMLFASPYRLGLTATPEREDGRHRLLPSLVGPVVFRLTVDKLKGKYVSDFEVKRIYVELKEDEEERYAELRGKMSLYLKRKKLRLSSLKEFKRLVFLASREKEGREALLAWQEALRIAVNSRSKIDKLREILGQTEDGDKVIVFTRDTFMAYDISKEFLIPAVTYKTPKEEREEILRKFKDGEYKVIVTSSVLDEGVDVPDANVAVLMAGYGTRRQFLQRLGRVLRKKEGKNAVLIELVTKNTSDHGLSSRRRKNVPV
ncbi:DEAD/DEAH box helicase [Sulfuracidifex tepidarius]|uniref:DNA 3'-5' helicase n=1 Tax=Sulfuracidifex tepidarius TaxID=1294262 RepID=A0A510E344_9CREN|nr:DEAD/DEAH box helicase [Sulfuracidifex tepidarius]BBG24167.1 UvrABC system protein B [Sulfuracidifex tepidarius]BBG26924.1 UvrABC system protein B [Sulfuracidifex tepidarius]